MFKKVIRNFIIVAMTSVTLVLVTINVVINTININRQISDSDAIIGAIENSLTIKNDAPDPKVGDSRYFIVYYNPNATSEAEKFSYNLVHIETSIISETTAKNYTKAVISDNKERGYKDIYRFHLVKPDKTYRIVFLDCNRSMMNYRNYTLITLFTSIGAFIVFFILVFFGSKYVLKPVKESYDKQNRFITNASHELKTPLAIIATNNEIIKIKKGNSEYSKNINKQINRMDSLIKDLTDLSKLNENHEATFENINLTNLLNDYLKQFSLMCNKEKIKLQKHIASNVSIVANKNFVNHIITIILDNARKYAKSSIDINLINNKNAVILKQTNDCVSVENGDLKKYTERFYRSNTSKNGKEGFGIGLSLLDELVNKINAKLKIYGKDNTYNIEIIFNNKNKIK